MSRAGVQSRHEHVASGGLDGEAVHEYSGGLACDAVQRGNEPVCGEGDELQEVDSRTWYLVPRTAFVSHARDGGYYDACDDAAVRRSTAGAVDRSSNHRSCMESALPGSARMPSNLRK